VDNYEWTNLAVEPSYLDIKKEFQERLPKTDAEDAPEIEKKDYRVKIRTLCADTGFIID